MTNLEIIAAAKKQLVAAGKIRPEDEIHTYNHWKHLGYQVFRGEKAVTCLQIWKSFQVKAKDADDDDEKDQPPKTGMRKKNSYFFSSQQVFLIDAE